MQITFTDMYLFDAYVITYHVYVWLLFCHENDFFFYTLKTKGSTVPMFFCDFFVCCVFVSLIDILRRLEHDSTVK